MNQKLIFPENSEKFNEGYNLLYSRCFEQDKELLNFIMIEASVGYPFVNKIKKSLSYLIKVE